MTEIKKPRPHSLLIKDIDERIIRLEKLIRDDERKRRGVRVWFLKRARPEINKKMDDAIINFKNMIVSEKERKRVLEIELEEFKRVGREEVTERVTNDFIEKYQKEFNVDYETAKVKVLAMREEIENKKKV